MDQEYIRDEKELERRKMIRLELERRKVRQQRITLSVISVFLVLLIILVCRSCANRREERQIQKEMEAANAALQQQTSSIKATVSAVGDIMCYDNQMEDVKLESGTYDFMPAFAAIKPYLEGANLTVGNLELNFCGPDAGYTGFPRFRAPESMAVTLKNVGFDILQTANTYSLQNGLNGLNGTIRYLEEQQIEHLGTYYAQSDKDDNCGVVVKDVNGIRIAFLGYTKGMNNMTLPEDAQYSVDVLYKDYESEYSQINIEALGKSVAAAKALKADVIIAMLHWGAEYEIKPAETQTKIADFLFNSGVDVILGSHSHEVGPMEMKTVTVDGKEKQVFVAYSLGNFYSSMTEGTSQCSVVLNLEFTMDAETGDTTISNVNYTPVYIADHGEEAELRYEILPVRSAQAASTMSHLAQPLAETIETLKKNTGTSYDSGK